MTWASQVLRIPHPHPTFVILRWRLRHGKLFLSIITNQLSMVSRQAHVGHTEQTRIPFMEINSWRLLQLHTSLGYYYNIQNYTLTKPRLLDAYKWVECCHTSPEYWTFNCAKRIYWSYKFQSIYTSQREHPISTQWFVDIDTRNTKASLSPKLSHKPLSTSYCVTTAATRQITSRLRLWFMIYLDNNNTVEGLTLA